MRISPKNEKEYPLLVRLIFRAQKRKYGKILEPTRLWGRSPKLLFGLQALYRTIDRTDSPIEPSLRSLVTVRVSQINHCSFCIDINSAILEKQGISSEKILSLPEYQTSDAFTEREKLALSYAEVMTQTGAGVTDELYSKLKNQFSDDEIIELTAVIAYQNLSSKFNAALDVPSQGFCTIRRHEQI